MKKLMILFSILIGLSGCEKEEIEYISVENTSYRNDSLQVDFYSNTCKVKELGDSITLSYEQDAEKVTAYTTDFETVFTAKLLDENTLEVERKGVKYTLHRMIYIGDAVILLDYRFWLDVSKH